MTKIRLIFEPYPTIPNTKEQIELALDALGVDYSGWEYAGYITMDALKKKFSALEDVHQYFVDENLIDTIPGMLTTFIIHRSER